MSVALGQACHTKFLVFHFHNKVILSNYHVSFIIKKAIGLPRVLNQLVQHLKVSMHLWYKCYMSSPGDEQASPKV